MSENPQIVTPRLVDRDRDKGLCLGRKRNRRDNGQKHGKQIIVDASGNELCTRPAGWATSHPGVGTCKHHLGESPNHQVAAQRVQAEATLTALGIPERRVSDPLLELQLLAGEVVGWKQMLARVVAGLESHTVGDLATVRGEVMLFERALDRCGRTLVEIGKLNIDERLARIREQQAAVFQALLGLWLTVYNQSLVITSEQEPRVAAAAEAARAAVAAEVERQLASRAAIAAGLPPAVEGRTS